MLPFMTEPSNAADSGLRAVGREVFVRRGQLGLTQVQVAGRAGVDMKTYRRMESGTPVNAKTFVSIALALGLDAAELQRIADGEPVRAAS